VEPVAIGIVGCGVIGSVHIDVASKLDTVKVAAIADLRQDRARAAAEKYGIGTVHPDGDSLIDDPQVEAVVLALPANQRTYMGLRAFARGKHVLTEKPVAMNADEVRRLIAAKGNLVGACCSSRYAFSEATRAAKELVASGALGQLRLIRCRSVNCPGKRVEGERPYWRVSRSSNAGGILVNWGSYDLDYLMNLTGWSLRPVSALGAVWPVGPEYQWFVAPGSDAETHVTALVTFEEGIALAYERGDAVAGSHDETWEIVGDRGTAHLKMTSGSGKRLTWDQADTEQGLISHVLWEGDDDGSTVHSGPVDDFAKAIRQGRPPQTGLEQALLVQRISDAIYRSASTGTAAPVV